MKSKQIREKPGSSVQQPKAVRVNGCRDAVFLRADLRITDDPRADHAQYLASWLAVSKADKKAIFTSASKISRSEVCETMKRLPPCYAAPGVTVSGTATKASNFFKDMLYGVHPQLTRPTPKPRPSLRRGGAVADYDQGG